MDVKEKLVELLKTDICPSPLVCDPACRYSGCDNCFPERYADHLIVNGVTVQEWIPASEPPKEDQRVLVWVRSERNKTVMVDTDRVHNGKWVRWGDCVTHWVPICMPEPPKGE